MITLEDLLRKYNFAPKKRSLFKQRTWIKDLGICDDMTATGHQAYQKLTNLIYDLCELLGDDVTLYQVVDELDRLTEEQY